MARKPRLHFMPVGDTDPFTPSRERPVRVRARSMPVDSHFEPQQLAYCASGIVQVTAEQSRRKADEITYIVPPSRAVWIAPGARHHITVLEAAEFRTLYIDASATPALLGHGLSNIVERGHAIGANVEIASSLGDGTTVTIRLPVGSRPA